MAFKNITKRLVSSAVIISAVLFAIFIAPPVVFLLFVEAFSFIALYEFYAIVDRKEGITINKRLGLAFGAALPLFFYFPGEAILIGFCILALFLVNFDKEHEGSALVNVAVTLLGILYVSWFFSFIMKIYCLDFGPRWVFFLLLVTKAGDAGAYFVGSKFGKRKLCEKISPNKTVEGAIGGLVTSVLMAEVGQWFLPHVDRMNLLVLGLALGLLAQTGDLVESLIKRDVGVKDSGAIPGLGGILDVLDSLLFTAPFLFYYLTAVIG